MWEERLDALSTQAAEAAKGLQALDDTAWPHPDVQRRTLAVLAYAQLAVARTDPLMLSETARATVQQHLGQFAADPASAAVNAELWGSQLLDALRMLPPAHDQELERAAKRVATTFQRSATQRLKAAEGAQRESQARIEKAQRESEQRVEQLAQQVARLEQHAEGRMETAHTGFEQQVERYQQALATEQQKLSSLRSAQTEQFEEADGKRAAAARDQRDQAQQQVDAQLVDAREQLDGMLVEASRAVEERVGEIQRMKDDSAKLVGAIGLAGTAERYRQEVEQQRDVADKWRLATVVLALLAVGGAAFALTGDTAQAEHFIGKLALSAVFGGVATYAARQSAYHRQREAKARDLELELTAFSPFIEPLSADQQEEERVIMTRKTFGKTTATDRQPEEPGPNPLSMALQRARRAERAQDGVGSNGVEAT